MSERHPDRAARRPELGRAEWFPPPPRPGRRLSLLEVCALVVLVLLVANFLY